MTGYLINLFKYAAIDTEDFEDGDLDYLNSFDGKDFIRSVVWSVFDRIEIRKIQKFEDFRVSQYSEKKWVGERQFALIYEINLGKRRLRFEKQNDDKCLFHFHKVYDDNVSEGEKEIDEMKYRFFGISMIDLAAEVHYDFYSDDNTGKVMYQEMTKLVDHLIKINQINEDGICYDLYGSLGGNDLVIIWLANQFSDVITIIEALRKTKIKNTDRSIVANASTIMGLRDIKNEKITYDDVKGNLNIRFTKKGTYSHEEFKNELTRILGNKTLETTLGEHDFSIEIPGIDLSRGLYNEKGFIHIGNENFRKNIIQANTELSVEIEYNDINADQYKLKKRLIRTNIPKEEKQQVCKNINEIVSNVFCNSRILK